MDKILWKEKKVKRQSLSSILVHWAVALSTFVLFFSGFGQLPMYKRFGVVNIPGLGWSGDYTITLKMHYIAGIVLTFAVFYHIAEKIMTKDFDLFPKRGDFKESAKIILAMLGIGKEPESDKYLAEQRLSYAFIGGNLLLIVITGLIKVYKNLPGVELNNLFIQWTTQLHNIATVLLLLGIIGHLGAFVFKANRKLLPAMFHGKVDLEYVKHRHAIWYRKLLAKEKNYSQQSGQAQ
ncbi:MAG: cytochrome b/b6 domain-containing protein [Firmicutes bacterium]|nr:cytochrome b/b6 domain-containing protein [Bacillota bacterium]